MASLVRSLAYHACDHAIIIGAGRPLHSATGQTPPSPNCTQAHRPAFSHLRSWQAGFEPRFEGGFCTYLRSTSHNASLVFYLSTRAIYPYAHTCIHATIEIGSMRWTDGRLSLFFQMPKPSKEGTDDRGTSEDDPSEAGSLLWMETE